MTPTQLESLLVNLGIQDLRLNSNGWINGLCPYHSENRASFGIDSKEEPHWFNCFGCKAKGPLRQLLIDIGGLSEAKADQIANTPGPIRSRDLVLEQTVRAPRLIDESELYPFDLKLAGKIYLKSRGINAKTWETLGLVYDHELNRVLFPWFVGNKESSRRLLGVTGRTVLENDPLKTLPMFGTMKGQSLYLPNRTIKRRTPLIIVEGEIDAAHVWQANHRNVAATGFGSFTEQQAKQIVDSGVEEVVSFTDQDEAGEALHWEIVRRLEKLHVRISRAVYPEGARMHKCKDPADMGRRHPAYISAAIEWREKNVDFPAL